MKKHFFACLLALSVVAVALQEASAWCKINAGVGANIGFSTGGSKSFLWGAYQSSDYNAVSPQAMYPPIPGAGHGQFGAFGNSLSGPFGEAMLNGSGFGPVSATSPESGPMPGTTSEASPVKPAQYPATYSNGEATPAGYDYGPYSGYPYYPGAGYWNGN